MRSSVRGARHRCWLVLIAVLGVAGRADGQTEITVPLRTIIADREADGTLRRVGDSVRVSGTVTTTPRLTRKTLSYVILQDSAAGIRLIADSSARLLQQLRRGYQVEVAGVIEVNRGAEELRVTEVRLIGRRPMPRIYDVLVADLLGKKWLSQLVRVEGDLRGYVESDTQVFQFRDRTGEIPVRIPQRMLINPDTAALIMRGGRLRMVAVLAQRTPENSRDPGYRLAPREAADMEFAARPNYLHIASGVLLFALLALGGYLWRRRRLAETRALMMEAMSDVLRQSEAALRVSELSYRTLMEQSTDGIIVFGEDLIIRVVNDTTCRMLRTTREWLIGRSIAETLVAGEFDRQPLLFERLDAGEVLRREREMRREDGSTFCAEIASKRLPTGEYLGIARDISERRDADEKLRQSEVHLRQAQRMESIGRLAGGIAHDFNNILTAVQLHAESLLAQIPPDDPRYEDVLEIQRSGTRAGALTRQLLAFSRRQILHPQPLVLNEVVGGIHRMLQRLLGEDLLLALRLSPAIHMVIADPGQIEQVIVNLAVNARDAMPLGGTLTIATANVVIDEAFVSVNRGSQPGEFVAISVADTGSGMTPDVMANIFEPFFTTKAVGKGTGLGLSTVYGIVKQSGGYVYVETEVGRGTVVTVLLPRTSDVPEHVALLPERDAFLAPVAARTGATVLVVEDEDAVRGLVRRILEKQGFAVLEARHGAEALSIAKARPDCIDVVLSDVVMPVMGGAELRVALQRVCPSARVILTSGYTDEDVVQRGVNTDEFPFLPKPFTSESLVAAVRAALL